jgi:hypothetical protein
MAFLVCVGFAVSLREGISKMHGIYTLARQISISFSFDTTKSFGKTLSKGIGSVSVVSCYPEYKEADTVPGAKVSVHASGH